jgi:hypothetical protein
MHNVQAYIMKYRAILDMTYSTGLNIEMMPTITVTCTSWRKSHCLPEAS